jgi:hypothetical protein
LSYMHELKLDMLLTKEKLSQHIKTSVKLEELKVEDEEMPLHQNMEDENIEHMVHCDEK